MHTMLPPTTLKRRSAAAPGTAPEVFRQPAYDCADQGETMKLVVYVPGVEAAGVDIEAAGADLTVTARKAHVVRVNFDALHLEHAQRDYRLRLRLGRGFDYAAMAAELSEGVLTVTLPKRARTAAPRLRRVA